MGKSNKDKAKSAGRIRRPRGYGDRHELALKWAEQNENVMNILMGRPTMYKPQYCLDVMYAGKIGQSLDQFARDIGISRSTVKSWSNSNPDFLLAVTISKEWRLAWLEDMQQGQISGSISGNSGMLRFALVNAAPDTYADVKVIEARMANKPADEPPPIDFDAIPLEERMGILKGIRRLADKHETMLAGQDVEDAVIIEGDA